MPQHLRKPIFGSPLRRGHPLASGLELYVLFHNGTAINLVNDRYLPLTAPAITVRCVDGGHALRGKCTSSHVYRGAPISRNLSMFSRFMQPDTSSGTRILASQGTTSNTNLLFGLNANGVFVRRGLGASFHQVFSTETVGFAVPASIGMSSKVAVESTRLFVNGRKTVSDSANAGTGPASLVDAVFNLGFAASADATDFPGDIEVFALWSRELPDFAQSWLDADPYDLVRARRTWLVGGLPFGIVTAEVNVAASIALKFTEAAAPVAQVQISANIDVAHEHHIAASISAVVNSSSAVFKSIGNASAIYSVADNADDGFVNAAGVVTNGVVTATNTSVAFMRFQNVFIPKDGYIRDAFLMLNPTTTTNTITNVVVYASNLDYSYIPTSYGDFLLQPRTAVVSIAIPPVTINVPIRLQNLAPALQNLADRTNLQSPTAIVLFVDSRSTTANIGFTARDSNPTLAAQLFLEYGVYTTLKSNTMTAISTVTANVRLFPIVAADITATTSIGARLAERMTISASATAITTILAGVTPNPVPIAAAITVVASITATMNTLSYSQANAFAQVTIFGELRVVRQLPISVGFDFTDTDLFRLRVSSVVVDVSA